MDKMREKAKVLDKQEMGEIIRGIADKICEHNPKGDNLAIVGIRTRGAVLAARLRQYIEKISGLSVPLGALDITLYRDDLSRIAAQPVVRKTEIDFDIEGKVVILVDDVLYTGRTVRCALSELSDFGRPAAIRLAVLIDRGHRELPIYPDYVGKGVCTSLKDEVVVKVKDVDGKEEVAIFDKG